MKKIVFVWFVTSIVTFFGLLGLYNARVVRADFQLPNFCELFPQFPQCVPPEPPQDITICHHNPARAVTLTFKNQQAYEGHLGQPHNDKVYDTKGKCEHEYDRCETVVSNCKEKGEESLWCKWAFDYCDANLCDLFPENEECVEPSPTPTPVPQEPQPRHTSEPSAPVCTNGVPALVPLNPHVVRNGSDATVNAHIPEGDRVNIYFRENSETDWVHAERDIPVSDKYLSYTIHELNPATGYTFGIQAANGCAGGETVLAVIVDPPANGVTFPLSYWEWLR